MVACVLIPRFELAIAAGGLEALAGRAVALAPDGSSGPIGEVSGAAQASAETEASAVQILQTTGMLTNLAKDLMKLVDAKAGAPEQAPQ